VAWWQLLKVQYCDAYFLMFEEGAIYFEEEQEVALWRAQLLMFFFSLQTLFSVAWEGHDGFERIMQAICPPFAKLPLQPPKGMEATGAVIRGIAERARLAGEETVDGTKRNLAIEAGEFQEAIRSRFETELFACKHLVSIFDKDGDGEITLEEFIDGIRQLPASGQLRFGTGVPSEVLDLIIRDLATELFYQIDDDGNGTLTNEEIRDAIEMRRKDAARKLKNRDESLPVRLIRSQVDGFARQIPGTKAHKQAQEDEQERVKQIRGDYENFLETRRLQAQAQVQQLQLARAAEAERIEEEETANFDFEAAADNVT